MKKYWHIALMLFCVLMITSCGDDEALEVDEVWKVQNEETFIDGTVFDDKSFEAGAPAELTVSEMVDGFATALQNMHPGDRWEIWIPQQMGYGSAGRSASGSVIIKPYTTLIFDLEVTRIVKE